MTAASNVRFRIAPDDPSVDLDCFRNGPQRSLIATPSPFKRSAVIGKRYELDRGPWPHPMQARKGAVAAGSTRPAAAPEPGLTSEIEIRGRRWTGVTGEFCVFCHFFLAARSRPPQAGK